VRLGNRVGKAELNTHVRCFIAAAVDHVDPVGGCVERVEHGGAALTFGGQVRLSASYLLLLKLTVQNIKDQKPKNSSNAPLAQSGRKVAQ